MSILVNKKNKVLIQGITGYEGSRACSEMISYGTDVVAGVTPGKGGGKVAAVPVYDTVKEALAEHSEIDTSLINVPPFAAKDAVLEALSSGVRLVNLLTEHIPVEDVAYMIAYAKSSGAYLVGPSSVGILSPGLGKIGSIGSGSTRNVFTPGPVGVVSKSGGMTAEISHTLTVSGIGQSTVIGIGGDQLIGFDFRDALALFDKDPQTSAVVLFGEVGGTYEEEAAEFIKQKKFKKPVVALIAGKFSERLPRGTVLGHAGTIVSRGKGSYNSKVNALRRAGASIADTLDKVPALLKSLLKNKI